MARILPNATSARHVETALDHDLDGDGISDAARAIYSSPAAPPADHLTAGYAPVVPATHLDAPVSDVVWDCLAGDLDGETAATDLDVVGDVHELATLDYDEPSEAAWWDETDRTLARTCRETRARRVA